MVLIAIHRDTDHPDGYVDGWAECLVAQGVRVRWVDLTALDALRQVQGCEGVMWHWRHTQDKMIYRILQVIEFYLGIPIFPNHCASWHRHDKLAQYYLFQAAGAPMPKSWIFWDKQRAMEWALKTDYPKVFKLSSGTRARDVVLVSSSEEARRVIDGMFGSGIYSGKIEQHVNGRMPRNWQQLKALASRGKAAARYVVQGHPPRQRRLEQGYVYFQEFIPGNGYKIGIAVIGDRAFGCRSFNRKDDFRTYGKTLDFDPSHIDLKCVQIAFDISERLGFPMMAYDFLLDHGEPVVLEMDFRNGKRGGHWKRNLEWVSEPIQTQEAQVETFLHSIRSGNGKPVKGPDPLHAGTVRPEMGIALP